MIAQEQTTQQGFDVLIYLQRLLTEQQPISIWDLIILGVIAMMIYASYKQYVSRQTDKNDRIEYLRKTEFNTARMQDELREIREQLENIKDINHE